MLRWIKTRKVSNVYRRSYIHDGGPVGIAVSVVIVIIAALNLVVPRMSASAC